MTNIKPVPRQLAVEQGRVKCAEKFKYLGEWIEPNVSENEAFVSRINKIKMTYQITKAVYNKRSISINAKFRHYYTVIRLEALYAAEYLAMNRKGLTEKLEVKERKKDPEKNLGPSQRKRYVDYQFPHFNTPVIDLIFFIYSSLRIHHLTPDTIHDLLTAYHEELVTTFRVLHHEAVNIPSVEELKHKMDEKFEMCVVLSMFLLPLMISPVGVDIDAAAKDTSTGYALAAYQNEPYTETLQMLLPQFIDRGFI